MMDNAGWGPTDRRERANLKARGPIDTLVTVVEEARRTTARAMEQAKRIPHVRDAALELCRLAVGLVTVERDLLESSEIAGQTAAEKIPKPEPRTVPESTIAWCNCGMYQGTPHADHRRKHPEPEEVPP